MAKKSIMEQVAEERDRKKAGEAKRAEYLARIGEWQRRGFNTDRLSQVIAGEIDIEASERAFISYEADVRKLGELNGRLQSLLPGAGGLELEVAQIRRGLANPDSVRAVEEGMADLTAKVEARKKKDAEARVADIRKRVAEWKEKGYNVARFEAVPDSEALQLAKEYQRFEADVKRLWEIKSRVEALTIPGLQAEADAVKALLTDPDRVDECTALLAALEKKSAKRGDYLKRLQEYRARGYNAVRLEKALTLPMDEMAAEFERYDLDARKLYSLWERLRGLDAAELHQEWEAVRQKITDPDALPEIEQGMAELEKKAAALRDAQKAKADEQAKRDAELYQRGLAYIADVGRRLLKRRPEYTPHGGYVADGDWQAGVGGDGSSGRGVLTFGLLTRGTVVVEALYVRYENYLLGVRDFFAREGAAAQAGEQFVVRCYVVNRLTNEWLKGAIGGFRHSFFVPFIYELEGETLHCNRDDARAGAYAGWFEKGGTPPDIIGVLKSISNKNQVFTRKDMEERLGLDRKECENILNIFLPKNRIIEISKAMGEYSFLDEEKGE